MGGFFILLISGAIGLFMHMMHFEVNNISTIGNSIGLVFADTFNCLLDLGLISSITGDHRAGNIQCIIRTFLDITHKGLCCGITVFKLIIDSDLIGLCNSTATKGCHTTADQISQLCCCVNDSICFCLCSFILCLCICSSGFCRNLGICSSGSSGSGSFGSSLCFGSSSGSGFSLCSSGSHSNFSFFTGSSLMSSLGSSSGSAFLFSNSSSICSSLCGGGSSTFCLYSSCGSSGSSGLCSFCCFISSICLTLLCISLSPCSLCSFFTFTDRSSSRNIFHGLCFGVNSLHSFDGNIIGECFLTVDHAAAAQMCHSGCIGHIADHCIGNSQFCMVFSINRNPGIRSGSLNLPLDVRNSSATQSFSCGNTYRLVDRKFYSRHNTAALVDLNLIFTRSTNAQREHA